MISNNLKDRINRTHEDWSPKTKIVRLNISPSRNNNHRNHHPKNQYPPTTTTASPINQKMKPRLISQMIEEATKPTWFNLCIVCCIRYLPCLVRKVADTMKSINQSMSQLLFLWRCLKFDIITFVNWVEFLLLKESKATITSFVFYHFHLVMNLWLKHTTPQKK